ncbi:MAG TPA: choice-of-anchor tandem repeat GloVer-containing protein [Rhizomicrobium sp.]|jgi:uncharacterized repeat protein (TIGR03803 family)|nr:choice-of-anchor tandem repeat GloVer-containing protein [Rhizomicrobium sp.]
MLETITENFRTILAGALVFTLSLTGAGAETFKVIYAFKGGSDGGRPLAGLTRDADGNLYGTTQLGGSADCGGCGTVFKIAPDGTKTVLYSFVGGSDGAFPSATLIRDAQGNLYGTTVQGGNDCHVKKGGCGTIFKIAPDGHETVLYAFKGHGDGGLPYSSLLADAAGDLYGTTYEGGDFNACYKGCGTVFKLHPDGREKTLYTFHASSDGGYPYAGLIRDGSGNLYGTTSAGGGAIACGTIFRLTPKGSETVLYDLLESDGCGPAARLFADNSGNLYGTAEHGGYQGNAACGGYYPYGCGTVFRLSRKGAFKVLHAFHAKDGDDPVSGVVMDAQGDLYGTTTLAGDVDAGTLYKISGRTRTIVHMFKAQDDGAFPFGDLTIDDAGILYGTAAGGGDPTCGCGTVYAVTP